MDIERLVFAAENRGRLFRFGLAATSERRAIAHVFVGHVATIAVGDADELDPIAAPGKEGSRAAGRQIAIIRMCADTEYMHDRRILTILAESGETLLQSW